jgi:mono/diheme cytochrome c family protein
MKVSLAMLAALALAMGMATSAWAADDDASALYKTKCSSCHGAEGQGKIGPALKGTSLSEDQIVDVLTKGTGKKAPHTKPMSSVSADQAKALASYIKSIK